jgi:hypothetical protein
MRPQATPNDPWKLLLSAPLTRARLSWPIPVQTNKSGADFQPSPSLKVRSRKVSVKIAPGKTKTEKE